MIGPKMSKLAETATDDARAPEPERPGAVFKPHCTLSERIQVKKKNTLQYKMLPEDDWTTAVVLSRRGKAAGSKSTWV